MESPNVEPSTYNQYTQRFKPLSYNEELEHARKFFTLNTWQYLIILAIGISGTAAFVNTYDALSNINSKLIECTQSAALQKELNIQFIVILVLSCVAIVFGALLAWFFRAQENQRKLLTWGIISAGIFGIVYALSVRFQSATNKWKIIISWFAFLFFMALGYFLSTGNITYTNPLSLNLPETQETDLQN